jgi:hypothetical protein
LAIAAPQGWTACVAVGGEKVRSLNEAVRVSLFEKV